ncbi:MAG: hypothetical protein QOI89_536 [Solirubrobacteraceae bacterium]|jgi:hypothetical protein|nr:hypothetical protein [Solirubrobacteraceae bacterium]
MGACEGDDLLTLEHQLGRVGRVHDWKVPLGGLLVTALLLASSTVVAGCGGAAQTNAAQKLERASIVSKSAPLAERLVKQSEIEAASDTAAVRSFLQLWSLLQFQSWDAAEQLFEPGLRDAIGPPLLAQTLEGGLIIWQATKPRIVSAQGSAGTATITFLARDEQGNVVPTSISFGGAPGNWRVSYFPVLNGLIQRTVQLRVQAQLDPLGTKPNAEAVRQGHNAANIQSTYLERKLHAASKH